MPLTRITPDLEMFYRDEAFADPWREAEPMLLLHGNAENGEAWNSWMPVLGREFRVVRPDMRGFGGSTAMALDYPWSMDRIVDDFLALADQLGLASFHLVSAKIGCPIAMRMAARHPDRLRSLAVVGGIVSGTASLGDRAASWLDHIERNGVESWARWTMPGRLGAASPPEMMEGWAKLMGATARSTQLGFIRSVPAIDVRDDLPGISCPTLVITTDGSGLGSVEAVRGWQKEIRGSEFMVVPGDSYHVAATHPDACARAVVDFIRRRC
ncbi:MAG: alpha/beta hydrolase [Rubritepida sp.]|nr:alpha/beta hydrolase [Rubritepida sp.]